MEIKSNSMVWCVYVSLTMFVSCIYLFGCLSVCVRPISASKFFFKQKSVLVERIDLLSTVSWDLLLLLNYWWERRHNISQSCHRWYFSIFYWINRAKKTFTHNVFLIRRFPSVIDPNACNTNPSKTYQSIDNSSLIRAVFSSGLPSE